VQDSAPGVADVSSFGATRGTLSSAPGMIGDQFGSVGGLDATIVSIGPAIHHTTDLGGINDIHAIQFVNGANAVFPNGPNGPPFYVLPDGQGPTPPQLGQGLTGLIDGTTGDGPFTATLTGDTANIAGANNNQNIPIINAPVYFITRPQFVIPTAADGSGSIIGRQKISENNSPLPRDRVYFNYSLFHNTPLAPGGLDVHRYTPGFEKTVWDGMTSFEARFPFASTLDTNLNLDLNAGTIPSVPRDVEFGNISLILKMLLWQEETWAVSAGLQIALPTAKDVEVRDIDGTPLVEVNNDAAHLAPFVGFVYSNGRLFTQSYLQIDTPAQGNRVWVTDFQSGLQNVGEIDDTTFLYADWGLGYWAMRNPNARLVTAAAPVLELHLNQSLEATQVLRSGAFQIGTEAEDISVLNMVLGGVLQLGSQSTLSIGYATPLGGNADREFDGEFRLIFNRYFGPFYNVP
jgi:hypothetical protein